MRFLRAIFEHPHLTIACAPQNCFLSTGLKNQDTFEVNSHSSRFSLPLLSHCRRKKSLEKYSAVLVAAAAAAAVVVVAAAAAEEERVGGVDGGIDLERELSKKSDST